GYDRMTRLQLAAVLGNHPDHSAQKTTNHCQHKNNATGKPSSDSGDTATTSNRRRFLAALASPEGRSRAEASQDHPNEATHAGELYYFFSERNRLPKSVSRRWTESAEFRS